VPHRNAKRANRPNPRIDRPPLPLESEHRRIRRVELIPRNLAQERYIDALYDDSKPIVFAVGPAGSGKTMIATEFAIKSFQEGRFKRIVITRPAISVDEQHGFLPGDLIEKMHPWMMPILDVFKKFYTVKTLQTLMANEVVEIAPLAYMRGRTFSDAMIIADEMQNSTISQTKMVLTRIGDNSRLVLTGDLQQHDRGYDLNGMKDFLDRLKHCGSKGIAVIEFCKQDVIRHPIIEDVLRIYGE
jgi:phosphate starvation-inducible protein PhoH and related proteins